MPVSSVVQSVFDELSEAASSGNQIPGISTGLPDLDRVTLGLNKIRAYPCGRPTRYG